MLTYEINGNNFGTPYENVEIISYERMPYNQFSDNNTLDVITYKCKDSVPFVVGQDITVFHSYNLPNMYSASGFTNYNSESKHTVYAVDEIANTFSIIVEKYIDLNLLDLFEYTDDNNVKWWQLIFKDGLVYSEFDYQYDMSTVYIECNTLSVINKIQLNCNYFDNTTLRWRVDMTQITEDDVRNVMNSVYTWEYVKIDPLDMDVHRVDSVPNTVTYDSEEYIKTNDNNIDTYYKKVVASRDISSLTVSKDSILFSTDDTITIIKPRMLAGIKIPLSLKYDTELANEELVRDNLVDRETKKSINKVIEMEKNIYTPVIKTSSGDFAEVHKIRFNMHFRKHRGQNWLVEDDNSLWNGSYDDGTLYYHIDSNQHDRFFSYTNESDQSDLLMFLGFTNADVRFRKSRLSKSFLRLSFYDSTNPADQNLLAYSTIYLDAANLYSKIAKYSSIKITNNNQGFTLINFDESPDDNTNGIQRLMVNCEPQQQTQQQSEDDVESKRLSSQIIVKDRNNSRLSSEGFYLYLWKDIDERNVPQTIYMKPEFHHAGYGRKIPFMAPYDKVSNVFKSFDGILTDWVYPNTGYDFQQYNDYSYIRFKYVYDNDNDRHVYYLDRDIYSDSGQNDTDNSITINLYEAKVRF